VPVAGKEDDVDVEQPRESDVIAGAPDDGAAPAEVAGQDEPVQDEAAPAAGVAVRRRSPLRRGLAVATVAALAALAVSAFTTAGSAAVDVDQHFVDATRAQGYVVESDAQRTLLVSAARKICERRENHSTVAQRRATALSSQELSTVTDTFAGNARSFTTLALDTYCAG
jgi:hypothetical protein